MPLSIKTARFNRFASNFVTVESWRRRAALTDFTPHILRMYYTKKEMVIVYQ